LTVQYPGAAEIRFVRLIRLSCGGSLWQAETTETREDSEPDRGHTSNEAITQKFGALGLGLAIARAVVKADDGEIRAESAGHNQGATFTVRLPLWRTNE
jgi:hypothetical protein